MVVMFVGLLWWGRRTFPYYSYCRNPTGQDFFVPARIHRGIPVNTVNINCFGSLQDWINETRNKYYWNQLIKRLLHPDTPPPERPKTWRPLQADNRQCPTDHDADYDKDDENSSNAGSNNGDGNRENHRDKESHGPGQHQHPPLKRRAPPPRTSNDRSSIRLPLLNTIQNSGSTMRISAYKLDAACSNHLQFLVSDSERLKPKSKSTIDNLPANIILTTMTLQSLVSPHLKLLLSSSFWTMRFSTSKIAHKLFSKVWCKPGWVKNYLNVTF